VGGGLAAPIAIRSRVYLADRLAQILMGRADKNKLQ